MSEYTKGPWVVRKWSGEEWPEKRISIAGDDDALFINARYAKNVDANARLIAAAPELLEACEEFVRKVECGEAKSTRSYAQMKAVIAKAKGEK